MGWLAIFQGCLGSAEDCSRLKNLVSNLVIIVVTNHSVKLVYPFLNKKYYSISSVTFSQVSRTLINWNNFKHK